MHRTLRVSVERLDGLSALSAELTQIRLALEERKKEFRGLARDLREEDSRGGVHSGVACPTGNTARLALSLFYSRVLTDLGGLSELDERFGQETRELRLVPLTVLFEIVPGAVRRLAAQQGKEVQTTIQEGGALIDRRIAEELGAPLVHLISNTLTHGIEPPEERIRLGKPRCGLLSIEATQRGDRLVLEVRDDGAGIDIERLRRTAVDLRMMSLHSAGLLTEEQALQLIFQPGFTITRCADENSGRGAGLDAVRSAVENLGGRVGVATEPGRGTRFILDLPRALATLWTVLVEVGGRRFALPLSGLDGTFTAPTKTGEEILADIPALSGVEMPIVDLGALLGLEPRYPGLGKKQPLVVAKTPGGATAFAVEAIREERELVVRRLGQAIGPVPGIAGAAILGSGEVVLVLDLPSLTLSLPPRSP
jgi:two-component system chemotaxis sensor kinase CheA